MLSFIGPDLLDDSSIEISQVYCSPLHSFIKLADVDFVTSFTDARDVRYNHKMAPAIWKEKWRKGSQVSF